MRTLSIITVFLLLIGGQCLRPARAEASGKFVIREIKNPAFHSNELFRAYENYYSPRIKRLHEQYGLDKVVSGETDEFTRILLLRYWIHSNMRIEDSHPTHTREDVFAILEAAKAGGGFQCSQFSIVQNAVLNSFGYVTRRLGAGPGQKTVGRDGHHAANEVWINTFSKWVLIDAKYDLHFEKHGVPLSALEVRDEVWHDGGKSVVAAFGPDRKPTVPRAKDKDWEIWTKPEVYRWCSWETSTNRFTAFPGVLNSSLVMYEDDIFRKHLWYRGGKAHWAYNTPYLIKTTRRDWIYWTPNVILSQLKIREDQAHVFLQSFTPNFKTFQVKTDNRGWTDCKEYLELTLEKSHNYFIFRTVNLFGVTGPEHRVEIDWKRWNLW